MGLGQEGDIPQDSSSILHLETLLQLPGKKQVPPTPCICFRSLGGKSHLNQGLRDKKETGSAKI